VEGWVGRVRSSVGGVILRTGLEVWVRGGVGMDRVVAVASRPEVRWRRNGARVDSLVGTVGLGGVGGRALLIMFCRTIRGCLTLSTRCGSSSVGVTRTSIES
jgi:hypothetical protein